MGKLCSTDGREEKSMRGNGGNPEGNWSLERRKVKMVLIKLIVMFMGRAL